MKKNVKHTCSMFFCLIFMACQATGCTTKIDPNARAVAKERLKAPSKCLEVVVESEPSGASVFGVVSPGLNLLKSEEQGSFLGKTPLRLRYTRVGKHVFGTKPDETLEVRETANTPVQMAEAYLAFRCFLLKDGYEAQMVTEVIEDRELDQPMEPGRVNALDGGKRVTVKSRLKPANVTHVKLRLAELQAKGPTAMTKVVKGITIISDPDGADVYVDGNFVGNAPCTIPLEPGLHGIELRKTEYETFRRQLKVFKDTPVTVRAKLARSSDKR